MKRLSQMIEQTAGRNARPESRVIQSRPSLAGQRDRRSMASLTGASRHVDGVADRFAVGSATPTTSPIEVGGVGDRSRSRSMASATGVMDGSFTNSNCYR